jgi:hypothetical protein
MIIEVSPLIITQINRRNWWHKPPDEPNGYLKRGMFLAQTYRGCEFYGRPLIMPIKVYVKRPLIANLDDIIIYLFGKRSKQMNNYKYIWIKGNLCSNDLRFEIDNDIGQQARAWGFDSIIDTSPRQLDIIRNGRLPKDVDLNVLYPATCTDVAGQILGTEKYQRWSPVLIQSFKLEKSIASRIYAQN